MSGHQSPNHGAYLGWSTPPDILNELGPFDLDPCQPGLDGLGMPWHGRVWLNPPYTRNIGQWLKKMAQHNNGIALIFARTETQHFFDYVWGRASAILFLRGRLHFYRNNQRAKHNAGAPSVLIAYGEENARWLQKTALTGYYIYLKYA